MKTIKKVVDPYNLFNPGKVSFPIFSVSDNCDTLSLRNQLYPDQPKA
jgi:hypothetical protein